MQGIFITSHNLDSALFKKHFMSNTVLKLFTQCAWPGRKGVLAVGKEQQFFLSTLTDTRILCCERYRCYKRINCSLCFSCVMIRKTFSSVFLIPLAHYQHEYYLIIFLHNAQKRIVTRESAAVEDSLACDTMEFSPQTQKSKTHRTLP